MKRLKQIVLSSLLMGITITVILACRNKTANPPGEIVDTLTVPNIVQSTVLTRNDIIWGMDWLPNGDMLFTEKGGRLFRWSNGSAVEITGVPTVEAAGQGGLLDVLVHPQYSQHDWIYFSYARTGGFYTLSRAKISGNALSNIQQLYTTAEASSWRGHYGSRIVIDKNRFLFFSVGDPAAFGQNTGSGWGKVHRIHDDGRIPSDNPVLPGQTAANTIWAYGVRNPQGLAIHPVTGELWESEHGPRGGDEVNIIKKGANYGWPLVSHGRNYDGSIISSNPFMTGVENAIKVWTPSIAPCGMDFLKHKNWKAYRNRLVVGALAFRHVANVKFNGTSPVDEFRWLDQLGRVRNVKEGPDGSLYVSVEGPGRIIRITPQ